MTTLSADRALEPGRIDALDVVRALTRLGELAEAEDNLARALAIYEVVDLAALLHTRLYAELRRRHPDVPITSLLPGTGGGGASGAGLPCNERAARELGTNTLALCHLTASIGAMLTFTRRNAAILHTLPASTFQLAASEPPHSMRVASPLRMRSAPITTASAPVLHALELVVTWLPRARIPETRAETPLAITCSTAVLPRSIAWAAAVRWLRK